MSQEIRCDSLTDLLCHLVKCIYVTVLMLMYKACTVVLPCRLQHVKGGRILSSCCLTKVLLPTRETNATSISLNYCSAMLPIIHERVQMGLYYM